MYMSVLFAISDLTTLKREVDYPLIFDAPHLNMDKINRLTCSVYRIEKQRPFDPNNLSTIRTISNFVK